MDSNSSKSENFFLIADFNSEPSEEAMKNFSQIHNFKNLLDKLRCRKNPINLSSVDLIITNNPRSFQNSCMSSPTSIK